MHEEALQRALETLQGVTFKGKQLKLDSQQDATPVVEAIQECNLLQYLELEGNTLGVDAALAIAKALESAKEFKYALWKDLFTGRLKTEIPKALKFLFAGVDLAGARLVRLDLSDNAIGPMAMPGLQPFFESPSSYSLKELILNNNGLGPEGGSMLAECLLECLESSKKVGGAIFSLRVFICGRNRLENKAATEFSKFLRKVKTLEEVQMMQNGIYAPGLKAVAEALAENPGMKVINLNDNTMKRESFDALANTISQLNDLEELSISDCLLQNEGALTLVNALRNHKKIERLILESNEIGKDAGIQIAEIIRTVTSVKMVNLGSNEFGNQGVHEITQLLREKELEIEDDQGESGGEEEDEEDDEDTENVDESYNLSGDQNYFSPQNSTSWNISKTFTFNNLTTNSFSTTKGLDSSFTFSNNFSSAAAEFWGSPSVDKLNRLQPNSFNSIKEYAEKLSQAKDEDKTYSEFCIQAAIKILDVSGNNLDRELFENLLIESYDSSPTTSAFSTYLLIYLGLMKSEDKRLNVKPVPQRFNAVKDFVRDYTIPKIICSSILEILQLQMTGLEVKPTSYLELEAELRRKIEISFSFVKTIDNWIG